MDELHIRPLRDDDDMGALTQLIHAAYAPLAERGMRYWASHQTVDDTRERCGRGETWLGEVGGRVVATLTLSPPDAAPPPGGVHVPRYALAGVAKLQQFCVAPGWKGRGVGRQMMDHAEARARSLGARQLALDTSEHAAGLIAMYQARGYESAGTVDYRPKVNYRSVLLALRLRAAPHHQR